MQKKISNDIGLALLRIVPSVLMITHGIPKFQNLISGDIQFGDPIGIGAAPSLFSNYRHQNQMGRTTFSNYYGRCCLYCPWRRSPS